MIEDPDGAPYPEAVQILWGQLRYVISPASLDVFREYLVDALESVVNHE